MFLRTLYQTVSLLPFLFSSTSAQTACNNSPSLCSKAYNNITHLGAHDSAFVRDASTSFSTSGNQFYNSVTQLQAGVRLLSAQVHKFNNSKTGSTEWHLCHTSCDLLDAGTLTNWLSGIKGWMDSNPNEVVTLLIVNSDNADAATIGGQFSSSGIDKYAYKPASTSSPPTTWPTLQSLISNGTRLMTFVASITPSSQYPYLMDEFTFIYENQFENKSPSNYSCLPDRPTTLQNNPTQAASSGRMFLMNHFLYSTQLFGIETPNNTYVDVTNAQEGLGSLGEQITKCTGTYSKPPNFVLVDFFNVASAITSVDKANGVSDATGRKSLPTTAPAENTSGSAKQKGSIFAVVIAVVVAISFGA